MAANVLQLGEVADFKHHSRLKEQKYNLSTKV
jgi:hypothetical protein